MDSPGEILRLCRLCLVKDQVNIPIFEADGDSREIFLKISSCLPVKVSREDRLPKKICDGCSEKLNSFYEFWSSSANAEKTLLSWVGEEDVEEKKEPAVSKSLATLVKEESEPVDEPHAESIEESTKDEAEAPPAKRARRSAAVKAQINLAPDSEDDDLDMGEPLTKTEEESAESDGEDKDPSYTDMPGTSADDEQAGPSGMGKDGVEAPVILLSQCPKCPFCGARFLTELDLQIHEPNCLPSTDQICLDCGLYFQNRRLLTMHQKKQHQRTSEAKFQCPECDKRYTKRWCLTYHVNRVHRGIIKVFVCKHPECSSKTFTSSSTLYTHKKTVHGESSSEGISCEYCGKLFKYQSGVNSHIKHAHVGTEPVPCEECGKSYKSLANLRFHIKSKHGDHKYQCEHCDKSFTYRSFYNKHLRVVHSGMKKKVYPCTICGKELSSSESQKVHVRTHTGERPFKCPSCDKAFISISHLRTHRVVHTKEKPFGCKLCDKRFSQRGTLGLHLKKNHPKEQPN